MGTDAGMPVNYLRYAPACFVSRYLPGMRKHRGLCAPPGTLMRSHVAGSFSLSTQAPFPDERGSRRHALHRQRFERTLLSFILTKSVVKGNPVLS